MEQYQVWNSTKYRTLQYLSKLEKRKMNEGAEPNRGLGCRKRLGVPAPPPIIELLKCLRAILSPDDVRRNVAIPSFHLQFSVLASKLPRVEIVDEHGETTGDKFYKAGSTIELKCVVSNIPQPTGYVTWRHGTRTLNYDTTRGGIRLKRRPHYSSVSLPHVSPAFHLLLFTLGPLQVGQVVSASPKHIWLL
ncbi:hypothetical protein M0802_000824 [Mischocyttarus mexicanus]|nr:hypothetical protein M0802_000824 [Mischocyttarus mexicanus]